MHQGIFPAACFHTGISLFLYQPKYFCASITASILRQMQGDGEKDTGLTSFPNDMVKEIQKLG